MVSKLGFNSCFDIFFYLTLFGELDAAYSRDGRNCNSCSVLPCTTSKLREEKQTEGSTCNMNGFACCDDQEEHKL